VKMGMDKGLSRYDLLLLSEFTFYFLFFNAANKIVTINFLAKSVLPSIDSRQLESIHGRNWTVRVDEIS
jgi:hypothetical protein